MGTMAKRDTGGHPKDHQLNFSFILPCEGVCSMFVGLLNVQKKLKSGFLCEISPVFKILTNIT